MSTHIHVGHVINKLAEMPDRSVHMVWTSVPYWGLRSYGTEPQVWGGNPGCAHEWKAEITRPSSDSAPSGKSTLKGNGHAGGGPKLHRERESVGSAFCRHCGAWRGEHGLEPSLDLWLAHEVEIFRAIRRVLRDDGTVWLNCGDAYASSTNGRPAAEMENDDRTFRDKPVSTVNSGFKAKDRIMMPARLAIALQEDRWWLRDEIVWRKPNPMPSSVRDRTTPAHEMLYMLSKKGRYFYDRVAIQEPVSGTAHPRRKDGQRTTAVDGGYGFDQRPGSWVKTYVPNERNKRSVWSISLEPFPGAHFATAPTKLVRDCILAGTSARGVCPQCGAPWERVADREFQPQEDAPHSAGRKNGQTAPENRWNGSTRGTVAVTTSGWAPTCDCPDHDPIPATVLDPFGGAGTAALVAQHLGRNAVLIELNPGYARMARERLRQNLGRVTSVMEEDTAFGLPLFTLEEAEKL